jgi:hypothetical protein
VRAAGAERDARARTGERPTLTLPPSSSSLSPLSSPSCSVDTKVAEESVFRQRQIDWEHRSNPSAHAEAMHKMLFPIVTAELK